MKKLPLWEYPFSTFQGSKNRPIRSFNPMNRGRHTHVSGLTNMGMPTPIYRIKWPNRSIFRSLKSRKWYSQRGIFFIFDEQIVWAHNYTWIFALNSNPEPKSAQTRSKSRFLQIFQKFDFDQNPIFAPFLFALFSPYLHYSVLICTI